MWRNAVGSRIERSTCDSAAKLTTASQSLDELEHQRRVGDVALHEPEPVGRARVGERVVEVAAVARVRELVDDGDRIVGAAEAALDERRPDEAGAAGHEHPHRFGSGGSGHAGSSGGRRSGQVGSERSTRSLGPSRPRPAGPSVLPTARPFGQAVDRRARRGRASARSQEQECATSEGARVQARPARRHVVPVNGCPPQAAAHEDAREPDERCRVGRAGAARGTGRAGRGRRRRRPHRRRRAPRRRLASAGRPRCTDARARGGSRRCQGRPPSRPARWRRCPRPCGRPRSRARAGSAARWTPAKRRSAAGISRRQRPTREASSGPLTPPFHHSCSPATASAAGLGSSIRGSNASPTASQTRRSSRSGCGDEVLVAQGQRPAVAHRSGRAKRGRRRRCARGSRRACRPRTASLRARAPRRAGRARCGR